MHGAPRVYALHYPTGLPVDRSAAQWGMGQAATGPKLSAECHV